MTKTHKVSTLFLSLLAALCCAVIAKGWGVAALASASDGGNASGGHIWGHTGDALALALIASMIPLTRTLIGGAGYRKATASFLLKAESLASGSGRAIAVVSVPDLNRLPSKKGKKAMESLRLYLESFLKEGEPFGRLDQFAYGLCLSVGDSEAFSQRLEILKQDVGFLYMAAYPGMRIKAHVTACRECGQGLKDALDSALTRNAPGGPDQGPDEAPRRL